MTPDEHYSLEFVGGPYDGYLQYVAIPQGNLIETVALPVNRNVLQVIKGEPPGKESRTRSVAIYELRQVRGEWKYTFLGSRMAGELDWDHWCTKVCEAWRDFHHH